MQFVQSKRALIPFTLAGTIADGLEKIAKMATKKSLK